MKQYPSALGKILKRLKAEDQNEWKLMVGPIGPQFQTTVGKIYPGLIKDDLAKLEKYVLARFRRKDNCVWWAILQVHGPYIVPCLKRKFSNHSEVDINDLLQDLLQETWVRLLKSAKLYKPSGSPLRNWLWRLAQSAAMDHLRQKQRSPTVQFGDVDVVRARFVASDPDPASETDPPRPMSDDDRGRLEAVRRLKPEDYRFLEEWSQEEALGGNKQRQSKRQQTAKRVRLLRLRKKLVASTSPPTAPHSTGMEDSR